MRQGYAFLFLTLLVAGQMWAQSANPQIPIRVDQVKFTSQAPTMGVVNTLYAYAAKAVSNDSTAKIWYSSYQMLLSIFSPSYKFTVDSATGLLKFTPTVKGWYTLGIVAHSTKGGSATQIFTVTITGGNGIVQGRVTDTLNRGIKGAIVELFNYGPQVASSLLGFLDYGSFFFCTVSDSSGNYYISGIDPASYKIFVVSPSRQYESQWYDGKLSAAQADTVHIYNNVTSLVNIKLRGGAAVQPKVTVSGSVLDTLKKAIKNAEIIFVDANFALNANDSVTDMRSFFDINAPFMDCRIDGSSTQVIHILDSSNGTFNANIPPGSYLAFARAAGYVTEFYQEQSSLLLATTIVVKQNTPVTNINFTLASVPLVPLGSIAGSVQDTAKDVGVPSRIVVLGESAGTARRRT